MTATDNARPNGAAQAETRAQIIARLNDQFRQGRGPGRIVVTPGVIRAANGDPGTLLEQVRQFCQFDDDNDPYGEHDFGSLDWRGEKVFWKIDYYDCQLVYASADPCDPRVTTRVLTLMLASEY